MGVEEKGNVYLVSVEVPAGTGEKSYDEDDGDLYANVCMYVCICICCCWVHEGDYIVRVCVSPPPAQLSPVEETSTQRKWEPGTFASHAVERARRREKEGKREEEGGRRMEGGGRWREEEGGRRVEGGGWREKEDGRRRMGGGGGGWEEEDGRRRRRMGRGWRVRVGGQLGLDCWPITGGWSDLTLILFCSLCFQASNSLAWLSIASRSYNSSQNKTQIEIRLNCVTGNGEGGHTTQEQG